MAIGQNFPTKFWVNIEYSEYSSTSSGYVDTDNGFSKEIETLEEANTALMQQINYYASIDSHIRGFSIVEFCAECIGQGEVTKVTGKRVIRRKQVKCPVCKGKNSEHYHVKVEEA